MRTAWIFYFFLLSLGAVASTATRFLSDDDASLKQFWRDLGVARDKVQGLPASKKIPGFDPRSIGEIHDYSSAPQASPLTPRTRPEDCGPVDLRKDFGDVRDQDGIAWCFSYVAADLLSQKLGKKVSALDMGLLYFQQDFSQHDLKKSPTDPDIDDPSLWSIGGVPAAALSFAIKQGSICGEDEMPSDDGSLTDVALREFFHSLDYWRSEHKTDLFGGSLDQTCGLINELHNRFPGVNDVTDYLAVLKKANSDSEALTWLEQLSCKHPLSVPSGLRPVFAITNTPREGRRFLATIDQNLNRGQATGIGYNIYHFLSSGELGTQNLKKDRDDPEYASAHASIIVGRRFSKGSNGEMQCQYLLRNSWGKGCSAYDRAPDMCDPEGNFWISEQEVDNYVSQLSYLKDGS